VLRTERGIAYSAAVDGALSLNPWQACPLAVEHSADEVLWTLARQYDVAPLFQAIKTRERREWLIRQALLLQQKRGTPWAMEEIMRLLGYTDAKVLDRQGGTLKYDGETNHAGHYMFDGGRGEVNLLRYMGNAVHDGEHIFSGVISRYTMQWYEFRIRLYLGSDSRTFTEIDRQVAALLVEDWKPLRTLLRGWDIRHVLNTDVSDPESYAQSIHRVVFDGVEHREHWIQPHVDGSYILRWRLRPDDGVRAVSSIALLDSAGRELEIRETPLVEIAPDVVYEGYWRFYGTSTQ
jgi:hypothetical protein